MDHERRVTGRARAGAGNRARCTGMASSAGAASDATVIPAPRSSLCAGPIHRIARAAAILALLATSACTLVGYPAGEPATAPGPAGGRSPDRGVASGDPPPGTRPPDPGHVYQVFGVTYRVLDSARGYRERGLASWYGQEFHGRPTATGETFDMNRHSAAHRTLPLHTWIEVTNLDNGRRLVLRVNDRGPFARTDERILDLSYAAARELGVVGPGTAPVDVRALSDAEVARAR